MPGEEESRCVDDSGVDYVGGLEVVEAGAGAGGFGGGDFGGEVVETFHGFDVLATFVRVELGPE
ncbi:hypothetical protein GLAREA_12189 [Glarea lozoyensis ATCC 20868]|uniref:Uncharacterized protein n=1 Tax=Glarea lozoyensis (strain ATCC 20868 / MF5171) TaxID=1116229 RepID=S3D0Q0_GLAL2|nr:uncharacterized protein GLAREA_12189 [Glarea lozoyensis ATCC 20868]EPE32107.1 hypothetical protein GLAREA_12189 [Glarea lozoyensis ATCC 20868]